MWKNRWRCHSLAFWCHSAGSYCYLCSPTPFSKFKCPLPPCLYSFRQLPIPSSCLSNLHYPAPHPTFYRSCLSHLPTFLSWGAGSSPSLLSLQVFLVADGAHAVGAGVTIETTSHSAKHWHLRLIGLLSHALTEGVRGMGEDIPENGVAEVSQKWLAVPIWSHGYSSLLAKRAWRLALEHESRVGDNVSYFVN